MSSIAVEVVALALQRKIDGKYLLARRGPGHAGAGHWEFPGGKVEKNEEQKQALAREIEEELAFSFAPEKLIFVASHIFQYPEKLINISLWKLTVDNEPAFTLTEHDLVAWCSAAEMGRYQLSAGDVYFIDKLL